VRSALARAKPAQDMEDALKTFMLVESLKKLVSSPAGE